MCVLHSSAIVVNSNVFRITGTSNEEHTVIGPLLYIQTVRYRSFHKSTLYVLVSSLKNKYIICTNKNLSRSALLRSEELNEVACLSLCI